MQEISTVDGFMEVNECMADMIKYLANEPSIGLFFVQQHAHNAVPNLISAKDVIADRCHEITLETEDLEDSISMVKSMKECGLTIADEMTKEIKKSLHTIVSSQQKKGLNSSSKNLHLPMGRSSSWSTPAFNRNISGLQHDRSSGSFISGVLSSAKQRAFRWGAVDTRSSRVPKVEGDVSSQIPPLSSRVPKDEGDVSSQIPPLSSLSKEAASCSSMLDVEAEELPLSNKILEEPAITMESLPAKDSFATPENYEKFRSEQEAKLEEWLDEHGCKENSEVPERNTL